MHRDKIPGLLLYHMPIGESGEAISRCIDKARAVFGTAYKPAREPHLTVTYSLLELDHESFRGFTALVSSIIGSSDAISANTLPCLMPLGHQVGRVSLSLVFDPHYKQQGISRNSSVASQVGTQTHQKHTTWALVVSTQPRSKVLGQIGLQP